jgi:catechol 2,3-dioxygenase-like lactoylglutathione lyase family enzyme
MKTLFTLAAMLFASNTSLFAQEIQTHGVKINVMDLDKAVNFYNSILGFDVEAREKEFIFLKSKNNDRLILHLVKNLLPEVDKESRAGLTLQVNDIDSAITRLKNAGVDFGSFQKRKEGVGYAIFINDPFGTRISLMHETVVTVPHFQEPRFYNYGFLVSDMNKSIDFYCNKLGFVQRSQKYLPLDMPLGNSSNQFAFMLHFREGTEAIHHNTTDTQHIVLLFKTTDLNSTMKSLKAKGVEFLEKSPRASAMGKSISFYDPFGYLSEIIEVK